MKNLKTFEKFKDIDPFGEENWNDYDMIGKSFYYIRDIGSDIIVEKLYFREINPHGYYEISLDNERHYSSMVIKPDNVIVVDDMDDVRYHSFCFVPIDKPNVFREMFRVIFEVYVNNKIRMYESEIEKIENRILRCKETTPEQFLKMKKIEIP